MGTERQHRTVDTLLQLKDAGLIAASAACQVGGVDKILDLGPGKVDAAVMVDISAMEVASGDESYTVCWQLSSSATFASTIISLIQIPLGDAAAVAILGDVDVPPAGTGRVIVPVTNVVNDVVYRYARLYTVVAGTIATGINYSAYLVKSAANAG